MFINDIKNYLFIKKQIKEMQKLPKWKELSLGKSFGSIYTVRNVKAEILGEQDAIMRMEKIKEYFETVFQFLLEWNLQDVMIPETIKQVKDSTSFLLVVKPFPKLLTMNYILALITLLGIGGTILYFILKLIGS